MAYTRYKQVNFGVGKGGLATVGFTLYNADGTLNTARSTTGVVERGTTTGIYGCAVSLPSGFQGELRWDTGGGTPVYASEEINPGTDEYEDAAISSRLLGSAYSAPPSAGAIASAVMSDVSDVIGVDVVAIKAKTDQLTFAGANVNSSVASYASGQDPATLLFAGSFLTLPGTATSSGTGEVLTFKQWMALLDAMAGGDNVSTTPTASSTFTVTYYLRGAAHTSGNVVYVATVTLDASKNQTARTGKVTQPFPAVN